MADDFDVIRAGIPAKDGCPVLTRIKAFITQQGIQATLECVMRDRQGRPLDLRASSDVSESSSVSAPATEDDTILFRVREFTAGEGECETFKVEGTIVDAANGVVRAVLPKGVYDESGIYRLNWGFVRAGTLKAVNEGLLSVERSLFFEGSRPNGDGPMTINEVRMYLADSSAAENQYLLDDVEFNDDQIVLALTKPIQYFNRINPPLSFRATTQNFRWKDLWLEGAMAELYAMAASHYRRNRLDTADAGIVASDKAKEPEYLRIAESLRLRFEDGVFKLKVTINTADCVGSVGSDYGRW